MTRFNSFATSLQHVLDTPDWEPLTTTGSDNPTTNPQPRPENNYIWDPNTEEWVPEEA